MNSRFGSTPKSFPVADIGMVLFDPDDAIQVSG
jgi:hypothetical protein